jgi:hypothetical protein
LDPRRFTSCVGVLTVAHRPIWLIFGKEAACSADFS